MTMNTIRIDGTRFHLPRFQDPAELKGEIVDAVRAGGGFVRLNTVEDEPIDVLVTPHTMLLVEDMHTASGASPAYLGELVPAGVALAQVQLDFEVDGAVLV